MGSTARLNGQSETKSSSGGSTVLTEDNLKANMGRLSVSHSSDSAKGARSLGRLSTQQNSDLNKDSKPLACKLFALLLMCVCALISTSLPVSP